MPMHDFEAKVLLSSNQVAALLREHRERRQLTQAQLAERLGLSKPRLSFLEQNPQQASLAQLLAWCSVLGLEMSLGPKTQRPPHAPFGSSG